METSIKVGAKDGWDVIIEQQRAVGKVKEEQPQQEAQPEQEEQYPQEEAAEKREREREKEKARAYSDKMNRLVQDGDLETLMAVLADDLREPFPEDRVWVPEDRYRKAMALLMAGIESAAQRDPERFVSFIGAKIIAFNSGLLVRSQMAALGLMRIYDRDASGSNGDLPKEVVEHWLPRITALQHAVEASAQVFAKVKHTTRLGAGSEKKKGRRSDENRSDHGAGDGATREQPRRPGAQDTPAPTGNVGGDQAGAGTPGEPAAAA